MMRVALIQILFAPSSRSATIQHLLAVVDRAAAATPAPDVLLLPSGCDNRGEIATHQLETGYVHGVRASLAYKAREWGVFLAAGLHVRAGGALHHAACLFDPDGDLAAIHTTESWGAEAGKEWTINVVPSGAGALAVIESGSDVDFKLAPSSRYIRSICLLCPSTRKIENRLATGTNCTVGADVDVYRAVVFPAADSSPARGAASALSLVTDHTGHVIARTESTDETIVYANVPIKPIAACRSTAPNGSDAGAD